MFDQPPPQRRDNGLRADAFVALADVDPRLGEHLLDLLRLADIAAYLEPPADPRMSSRYRVDGPIERLFVQSDLRRAAREVVLDAAREAGASTPPSTGEQVPATAAVASSRPDPLAGVDTDAEFARIMAGFDETAPAQRRGMRSLDSAMFLITDDDGHTGPRDSTTAAGSAVGFQAGTADAAGDTAAMGATDGMSAADVDAALEPARLADPTVGAAAGKDEDEHYVASPAPPFPIPRASTVGTVAVFVLGLLVLGRGNWFGLGGAASFPIGVLLILVAAGLFVRGLRETDPEDTDPGDGAII